VTRQRFVPVEEVRKLSHGSYEHVIAKIEGAVTEAASGLFGKKLEARICGTFPGSAVVMSEEGHVVRAFWEQAEDGSIKIVRHEEIDVPAYAPENLDQYVRKQVARAVEAWEAGRVVEAQKIIEDVAPYIESRPQVEDSKMVEMLQIEFNAPRAWRQLYTEQVGRIRNTVGEKAMQKIDSQRSGKKFSLLYNGELAESDVSGYRDLVHGDLAYLTTRVESLRNLVESSYSSLRSVVGSDEFKNEAAIVTLVTFTEDLISDLRRLHNVITEAAKTIAKIDSLGKLYDIVSEGLYDREVAGQFVDTMSTKLQETIK